MIRSHLAALSHSLENCLESRDTNVAERLSRFGTIALTNQFLNNATTNHDIHEQMKVTVTIGFGSSANGVPGCVFLVPPL